MPRLNPVPYLVNQLIGAVFSATSLRFFGLIFAVLGAGALAVKHPDVLFEKSSDLVQFGAGVGKGGVGAIYESGKEVTSWGSDFLSRTIWGSVDVAKGNFKELIKPDFQRPSLMRIVFNPYQAILDLSTQWSLVRPTRIDLLAHIPTLQERGNGLFERFLALTSQDIYTAQNDMRRIIGGMEIWIPFWAQSGVLSSVDKIAELYSVHSSLISQLRSGLTIVAILLVLNTVKVFVQVCGGALKTFFRHNYIVLASFPFFNSILPVLEPVKEENTEHPWGSKYQDVISRFHVLVFLYDSIRGRYLSTYIAIVGSRCGFVFYNYMESANNICEGYRSLCSQVLRTQGAAFLAPNADLDAAFTLVQDKCTYWNALQLLFLQGPVLSTLVTVATVSCSGYAVFHISGYVKVIAVSCFGLVNNWIKKLTPDLRPPREEIHRFGDPFGPVRIPVDTPDTPASALSFADQGRRATVSADVAGPSDYSGHSPTNQPRPAFSDFQEAGKSDVEPLKTDQGAYTVESPQSFGGNDGEFHIPGEVFQAGMRGMRGVRAARLLARTKQNLADLSKLNPSLDDTFHEGGDGL